MANKEGHRGFGNIRKLPSGQWQARYPGPDGRLRNAPRTFATKREGERWLSITEGQLVTGDWTDPERAKIRLTDYATKWINERPGLRPNTKALYEWLWSKHISPRLGEAHLGKITTAVVREWRAGLLEDGVSHSVTAKAYRLLRAIFNTAVDEDRILPRNPCRVRGADQENAAERPILTVAQVFDLAGRMPDRRYRVLILVGAFCTLRWGEVTALRRCDVAADGSWVRVNFAHTELKGRGIVVVPPKSRAGVRTLTVPEAIRPEIVKHLMEFTRSEPDALVFTGKRGNALRRGNFNQLVRWTKTVKDMGTPGLHFHDLRHTGNTLAAQTGVSTKDLMVRMGHDDMRAALIYQRASSEADRKIAERLSGLVDDHQSGAETAQPDDDDDPDEGTAGQPVPVG
jgi:integrase